MKVQGVFCRETNRLSGAKSPSLLGRHGVSEANRANRTKRGGRRPTPARAPDRARLDDGNRCTDVALGKVCKTPGQLCYPER